MNQPKPHTHPRPNDLLHLGPQARQTRVRDTEYRQEQRDGRLRGLPAQCLDGLSVLVPKPGARVDPRDEEPAQNGDEEEGEDGPGLRVLMVWFGESVG
jgi:hypothetical protein